MNSKLKRRLVFWLAVAATAGCNGDDPVDPNAGPGFLTVTINTPNTNDGAVMLTVSGGTMDSVQASSPSDFISVGVIGTNQVRAIVVGSITDGAILRFWVPERNDVAQYIATLEQAAVRVTYEQQNLGGYTLTVAR